ncbi:PREDICTED: light-regulated protein [Nelumbo nucifera]|uniref:Light-regulated protein-like n=2 Tax=Nelumbo nucifera TaxID=4432 RepID=A0A822Y8N6_NELNU|nr:PREDICTED: light-regulated protein [Nelumbo nucifera]DAD30424.1 TPA_asm: hypothetical protein HUJ06_009275 [Nelumbo nucifera]
MQASLCFTPSVPTLPPTRTTAATTWRSPAKLGQGLVSRCPPIKATAVAYEVSTVDYSSMTSVFPAEACETIGGEACDVEMYPEVKLKPEARSGAARIISELIDREYLEYNDNAKTVFPGEACDDLGGEFCEADYQKGVY